MNSSDRTQVVEVLKRNRRKTIWNRSMMCAAAFVVFITTYMLILPAITMSQDKYCGLEEHVHEEACYQTGQNLICEEPESWAHEHEAACLDETGANICGQEETAGHLHAETCYETVTDIICGMDEHTHTLQCGSNLQADVETAGDWEAALPAEWTGDFSQDVVLAAESQLGYKESTENYIVNGENIKGYTRYGEWYGEPYADWNALFVSFCMHYAGVDPSVMPAEADVQIWMETLQTEDGRFQPAGTYVPQPGDVVFFGNPSSGKAEHMGIVTRASESENVLKTIEGDSMDQVRSAAYELTNPPVIGYGVLSIPSQPEPNPVEDGEPLDENLIELPEEESELDEELQQDEEPLPEEEILPEEDEEQKAAECTLFYHDEAVAIEVTVMETVPLSESAQLEVTKKEITETLPAGADQIVLDDNQYSVMVMDEGEPVDLAGSPAQVVLRYQPDVEAVGLENEQDLQARILQVSEEDTEVIAETGVESGEILTAAFSMEQPATYQVMLMGRAGNLAAGKYGSYVFWYNEEKDAFTKDSAYDIYYNDNSPLGTAGSFHLVGFGTVNLGTHTNGNVLAHTLIAGSNFGTNLYGYELSYALNYQNVNSGSASSTSDHILVVGSNNTVTLGGNRDQILINGTKIDRPYNIVQDTDTASAPFIDLDRVEAEISGISQRLAKVKTTGVTVSFNDENNRSIILNNPNGTGFYTTTAKDLQNISNFADRKLRLKGFAENANGTIVINVDCTGVKTLHLPEATVFVGDKEQSTSETTNFTSGKVIWNLINAEGVTVETKRMTGMVVAPGATVNINQNLNGTVVAENINVKAESHRTDFTGEVEIPGEGDETTTELFLRVRKVDEDNISVYLDGAVFDLYRWDASSGKYVVEQKGLTYGSGKALVLKPLRYNQAYRLVETKAPPGYGVTKTPYEFMIPHSNTSKYPISTPSGFNSREFNGGQTIYYKNAKMTELVIEKKWEDSSGQPIEPAETEVLIDLWRYLYADKDRTELLGSEVYRTGLAVMAEEEWQLVLSDLPSSGNGVYYTYFVKEQSAGVYNVFYDGNGGVQSGTITITNQEQQLYELPATGGVGPHVYTAGGILLMAAALLLRYKSRRREVGSG